MADLPSVKFRLVYRGGLGQEDDAVIAAPFRVVSGILVSPSYAPADGRSRSNEPRLIYQHNGQWKLSKATGLVAGNIDWKGWYELGKASEVISWRGPGTRTLKGGGFSTIIYKDGEIYARTPSKLLGAALYRETNGTEWIVAICDENGTTVAYKRKNEKSDSEEKYHPQNVPDGWREIGRLSGTKYKAADRAWFFNARGDEAQTIRQAVKTPEEEKIVGEKLVRIKFSLASGVFTQVQASPLTTLAATYSQFGSSSDTGSSGGYGFAQIGQGSQIVAVDYIENQEVVCTEQYSRDGARNVNTTLAIDAEGKYSGSSNGGSEGGWSTTLNCNGTQLIAVPLELDRVNSGSTTISYDTSRNYTAQFNSDSKLEFGNIMYLDPRHNVVSVFYDRHHSSHTGAGGQYSSNDGWPLTWCVQHYVTATITGFNKITQSKEFEVLRNSITATETSMVNNEPFDSLLAFNFPITEDSQCFSQGGPLVPGTREGQWFYSEHQPFGDEIVPVDIGGNFVVSTQKFDSQGWYTELSGGGTLPSLIPGSTGGGADRYRLIGVIR